MKTSYEQRNGSQQVKVQQFSNVQRRSNEEAITKTGKSILAQLHTAII